MMVLFLIELFESLMLKEVNQIVVSIVAGVTPALGDRAHDSLKREISPDDITAEPCNSDHDIPWRIECTKQSILAAGVHISLTTVESGDPKVADQKEFVTKQCLQKSSSP